jgi:3-deoxy-D-manno-octulosonate 8-phosphate phosphatase KdsC-like HAD superfamily phosphatase
LEKNITTLYNNAKLHYQDVDLEAGVIIIDYKNELIKAFGIKDSLGYQQLLISNKAKKNQHKIPYWSITKRKEP